MTTRTFFAAIGDSESPQTWSGTPYHFLQAARSAKYPIEGLRFDLDQARSRMFRASWALRRIFTLRRPRGLQYDDGFLQGLWNSAAPPPQGSMLINCSQLFPARVAAVPAYQLAYYLDQTLTQLFEYYEQGAHVARDIQRAAIARERAQYRQATAIVLQSRWAARSVMEDYAVDPAKVHIVIPGANIDPATLAAWEASRPAPRPAAGVVAACSLKLGFVGKDWQRKGLDRLIAAVGIARAKGADVELHVAGPDARGLPTRLRDAPGVHWAGFIDKGRTPGRFTDFLDSIDIGCLLSRKEAGGVSLLEFARLGIPTLAPDTGGSPEYTVAGATTLIAPSASDAQIADAIGALANDPARVAAQRTAAWARRGWADWSRSVAEMRAILEPVTPR